MACSQVFELLTYNDLKLPSVLQVVLPGVLQHLPGQGEGKLGAVQPLCPLPPHPCTCTSRVKIFSENFDPESCGRNKSRKDTVDAIY